MYLSIKDKLIIQILGKQGFGAKAIMAEYTRKNRKHKPLIYLCVHARSFLRSLLIHLQ